MVLRRFVTLAAVPLLLVTMLPDAGWAIGVGEPAPDFTLPDADGLTYTLSGYRSHPVLLVFLGCNEDVSRSIASDLQTGFHDVYSSRGLYMLALESTGAVRDELVAFRSAAGVQFPLLQGGGPTQGFYDVPINSLVLVDAAGLAAYVSLGPDATALDAPALQSAVEEVLREANTTKTITWGLVRSLYK